MPIWFIPAVVAGGYLTYRAGDALDQAGRGARTALVLGGIVGAALYWRGKTA